CLDFLPVFDTVHRLGGRVVSVVYDLIPLRLPEFCDAVLAGVFRRWLELAVRKSDMLLCISQAVQDEVAAYLDNHGAGPHRPQLAHWPLGADIVPGAGETAVRPEVAAMVADPDSPLFLMVGTIEPRKGHTVVLDAFDALWAAGGTER
ncbi:glycosyltransferase family 1 protein, partial [Acinetobacter baumannii]|nr:glycosyltransferase family 1 protein [Acinetobacter baumannii]